MNCCNHSLAWSHYKRTPGNGQMYDWVCVDCLVLVATQKARAQDIHPWHTPQVKAEKESV